MESNATYYVYFYSRNWKKKGKTKSGPEHLPPNTFIFLTFPSSFPPSPKLFVAVTTNWYSLPFSKLTTTLRSEVSVVSFILFQFSDVPSSRTVLRYTVYWVIGAPLFSASFHFKVITTSFVWAGKSVISAAAGTPGLKEEKDKAKKKTSLLSVVFILKQRWAPVASSLSTVVLLKSLPRFQWRHAL